MYSCYCETRWEMDEQPSRRGEMCLLQTAIIQSVTNIRWIFFFFFFVVRGFFFFFLKFFLLHCSAKALSLGKWESQPADGTSPRELVNSPNDQTRRSHAHSHKRSLFGPWQKRIRTARTITSTYTDARMHTRHRSLVKASETHVSA